MVTPGGSRAASSCPSPERVLLTAAARQAATDPCCCSPMPPPPPCYHRATAAKYREQIDQSAAEVAAARIEDSESDFLEAVSNEAIMVSVMGIDSVHELEQKQAL